MVLHIFSDDEAWDFFRWNGNMLRKHTTIIVFTEEGNVEVLGVYALEGLGLEVDPATKELRKSKTILVL